MTPPTPNSTATTEAHTGIDTGTGTTSTLAEQLRQDARIRQAQELVLQALADYQSRITGIQSPAADRKDGYQSRLAEAAQLRGRPLYFPYLGSGLGNGALVELADGSVKYDMISGIGVHILGHSHPDIVKASMEAALSDVIMQGHLQQNEEPLEISRTLVEAANRNGAHLQHCFLTTSGAMANENALKILFHHQPGADRLLALSKNFAGRSLALSQITDRPDYRVGLPTAVPVDYVPFRDAHRPEQSTEQALQVLRRHLDRYPGRYAGMVFELVQGEGGVYPGDTRYFRSLMQCLREHKVPVLIDEIQTFGRTPELFAFQYYQLDDLADVVTIGKLSQVCATLFRAELNPQGPLLSQTFIAGTSALCAARTIL